MPIEPVSGKIEAQKINDNLSYLDSQVRAVNGGPKETFTSESALQSKYPSGSDSVMLVTDTNGANGYLYSWNGTVWVKGVLYQAQGIADKSIKLRKLGIGITQTERSNNLINLTSVVWDKYIDYNSGKERLNENYCYVKIPIDQGETYEIIGTNQQGCFLDNTGAYMSGWINIVNFPNEAPANATYICQTFYQTEISEGYISKVGESFHLPDVLDTNAVKDESIPLTKISVPQFLDGDINLFDSKKIEAGKYVDYTTGKLTTNAAYSASEFISIDFRKRWIVEGTSEQLAFYDSFQRYLGGCRYAYELPNIEMPSNARFIRLSIRNEQVPSVVLRPIQTLNRKWIDDSFAGQIGTMLNVSNASTSVVTVVKDGSGDFSTLRSALENTGWGVLIKVYDSIKLEEEYTESEIKSTSFVGFKLDNNRTLQGVGNVTISANLDSAIFGEADIRRIATLSVVNRAKLKNLTIIGANVRYACHVDYGNTSYFEAQDVHFVKENAGIYCQSLGGGLYADQSHAFKNCIFETKWTGEADIPVSYHTNNNFNAPAYLKFEDCRFLTNGSQYELRLGGMASNQLNVVELVGNRLNSVLVKEERMDGSGIDFLIRGRGNRLLTFKQQSQSGTESAEYDFVEEIEVI